MTKKKTIIFALIIILLITGYFIFTSQSTPESEQQQQTAEQRQEQEQEQMDAEAELKGAAMTLYSQDETTKWELKADAIEHFSNSGQTKLRQVTAEVYQQEEQVISLSAKEGTLDTKTGFLSLQGPVTIKSGAKVIKANRLNWNQAKNELIGRGDILLKQSGLEVRGEKFISQIDLSRLRVLENVQVTSQKEDDINEK
ncbi:LPS export ABC transporter periplasmic protein LptC [Halanaerobacter jeridensis]|uniref:LPS export ABC transporter protein LptC n=1 Tax=Halanaerobacter jeridensis TaxID=706427 RepID=A0A938XSM1_9FIRM|nr:LPS export ABC transporter periplasmic protein LptC [Halanaerobacter jeridensis]MBM7556966.1 LPS export ABC transporter protein LptC [Halanaerobacter jeridensis]